MVVLRRDAPLLEGAGSLTAGGGRRFQYRRCSIGAVDLPAGVWSDRLSIAPLMSPRKSSSAGRQVLGAERAQLMAQGMSGAPASRASSVCSGSARSPVGQVRTAARQGCRAKLEGGGPSRKALEEFLMATKLE
ncbi:hypothetical protein SEVIR_5G332500v4 [Setaria viridis]|uniref:Uncharacterized protein n=1 Tax=Setaria viridis TaxID=4556 RepID=A0A4V6D751_SETVI|nr:hypothetical protein SEVIR_5G332500v2 [Setaria viridis]